MRYFLCIVIAVACEAARIPRAPQHPYFPNFQSVYHGHGASSYQNVQVDNAGPPFGSFGHQNEGLHLGQEYHDQPGSIGGRSDLVNHLSAAPYEGIAANHLDQRLHAGAFDPIDFQ